MRMRAAVTMTSVAGTSASSEPPTRQGQWARPAIPCRLHDAGGRPLCTSTGGHRPAPDSPSSDVELQPPPTISNKSSIRQGEDRAGDGDERQHQAVITALVANLGIAVSKFVAAVAAAGRKRAPGTQVPNAAPERLPCGKVPAEDDEDVDRVAGHDLTVGLAGVCAVVMWWWFAGTGGRRRAR
jgi:hypothetical protein